MNRFYLIFIYLLLLHSCSNKIEKEKTYSPPAIEKEEFITNHFSKQITDSYRNIENTKDSTVQNWYKKQDDYAEDFLNRISGKDSLVKSLYEIDNKKKYKIRKVRITGNNNWFYLKKNLTDTYYKLYFRENEKAQEILLYDPKKYNPKDNKDYIINYIRPSWDSKFIVVSLSHSGKELSDLIVIDMLTKKTKPQIIKNAWPSNFLGINWLPDNSGFTFLYFPNANTTNDKFKQNSQSVLYLLDSDPKEIKYIFGNKTQKRFNINSNEYPITKIKSSNDKYLIGYVAGVDSYWNAYYAEIEDIKKGKLNWKLLHSKKDKIIIDKGIIDNEKFIYLTALNSPNKMIASVSIDNLNYRAPRVIAKEKENEIIDNFKLNNNNIYFTTTKYGVEAKLYKVENEKEILIETPKKAGNISLYSKLDNQGLWVTTRGWINSNLRYKYDNKTNTFTEDNISPRIKFPEFENLVVKELLVDSHDGEKVPFSVIHKKDIKKDGTNPVFIYSYGAYGDIESPYFSPLMLDFVSKGGIFAIAHVRGGGEKGEQWHNAGFKATKSNSWKDLIACTEYLINEKYTSKNHTSIYGSSAGGITVGRAMTERPDLFSAVVIQAGLLNPVRMESGAGGSNYKEFGSVKDSIECLNLIKMDSYQNIKKDIDYPATYLTIGMNDPLVNPWMTGKFVAKLQNSNKLKKPILLNLEFDSGHGSSNNELEVYKEWANIFSFVFWQTGHPEYQLKEVDSKTVGSGE